MTEDADLKAARAYLPIGGIATIEHLLAWAERVEARHLTLQQQVIALGGSLIQANDQQAAMERRLVATNNDMASHKALYDFSVETKARLTSIEARHQREDARRDMDADVLALSEASSCPVRRNRADRRGSLTAGPWNDDLTDEERRAKRVSCDCPAQPGEDCPLTAEDCAGRAARAAGAEKARRAYAYAAAKPASAEGRCEPPIEHHVEDSLHWLTGEEKAAPIMAQWSEGAWHIWGGEKATSPQSLWRQSWRWHSRVPEPGDEDTATAPAEPEYEYALLSRFTLESDGWERVPEGAEWPTHRGNVAWMRRRVDRSGARA